MHTCVYVENELEELLEKLNGKVEICIHSSKEGVWVVYVCICVVSNEIHVFMFGPIRRRKGSANGVYVWYNHTCKYMCTLFMCWVCYMCTILWTL